MRQARGVGYLDGGENYARGEVSELVFDRLVVLVKRAFIHWCGHHHCDLDPCGSHHPPPQMLYQGLVIPTYCDSDILVPAEKEIYIAPALILHYIRGHNYLPPLPFLEAVLACPDPRSPEYQASIDKICKSEHG